MTNNDRIELIAQAAKADIASTLAEPPPREPQHSDFSTVFLYHDAWRAYGHDLAAWQARQHDATNAITPLDLERWAGRTLTASDRTMMSKAITAGEKQGLWERIYTKPTGGKVYGVRLIESGADHA